MAVRRFYRRNSGSSMSGNLARRTLDNGGRGLVSMPRNAGWRRGKTSDRSVDRDATFSATNSIFDCTYLVRR
jgi:hypothetical protein